MDGGHFSSGRIPRGVPVPRSLFHRHLKSWFWLQAVGEAAQVILCLGGGCVFPAHGETLGKGKLRPKLESPKHLKVGLRACSLFSLSFLSQVLLHQ